MSSRMDRILTNGPGTAAALALAILLAVASCDARSGQRGMTEPRIAQALSSTNWLTRSQAVAALQSVPVEDWTPPVRDALIQTLGMEEGRLREIRTGTVSRGSYPDMHDEDFAEYYSALAGLVLHLNDPRALHLIVDYTPSSDPRLTGYIAGFGRSALPLVLARLRRLTGGSDFESQRAMLDTLNELMTRSGSGKLGGPLSREDLARIRAAAQPLLRDGNPWVSTRAARTLAVVGNPLDQHAVRATFTQLLIDPDYNRREIALSALRAMSDPRFAPIARLKLVAEQDNFRLAGPTLQYPAGAYPLRREAAEILKGLRTTR